MDNNFQERLFQRIKEAFSDSFSMEHRLAKILNVPVERTYQLLRSQAELTANEAFTLSTHFGFSLDEIGTHQPGLITFRFNALEYNIKTLQDFFQTILKELQYINVIGAKQMIYTAHDFPVFSLFQFPELAAFKIFFWGRIIFDLPGFDRPFDLDEMDLDALSSGERAWQQYLKMPSLEIWSSDIANNVLKQIYYFWEHKIFKKKEDAIIICDKLSELVEHGRLQAAESRKFHPFKKPPKQENFQLYYNEVAVTGNTLFIKTEKNSRAFVVQNTLNYLVTDHPIYSVHTERWLHQLRQNSTLISGAKNDLLRDRFFEGLLSNIAFVRERIGQG